MIVRTALPCCLALLLTGTASVQTPSRFLPASPASRGELKFVHQIPVLSVAGSPATPVRPWAYCLETGCACPGSSPSSFSNTTTETFFL